MTGLGAVTPIGADAPSTWRAAVAGESGIDFIRSFDTSEFPVRIAAEVKDFDPEPGGLAEGRAQARPQRPALARRGARGRRRRASRRRLLAGPGRDPLRHRDRRLHRRSWSRPRCCASAVRVASRRPSSRTSLVDTASGQLAISLGFRGPNYAPVSACATGSTAVGEAAELIKRGDADAVLAGGAEACIHPLILAGFCAMRGLVGRGRAPAAGVAAVRRDARRLRDGGGRVRARARGARGRRAPRRDRSTPRSSATRCRTTRTISRSPIPSRSASRR